MNLFSAEREVANEIQRMEAEGGTDKSPVLFLAGYGDGLRVKHLLRNDPVPNEGEEWADAAGMVWRCHLVIENWIRPAAFMRPASLYRRVRAGAPGKEGRQTA